MTAEQPREPVALTFDQGGKYPTVTVAVGDNFSRQTPIKNSDALTVLRSLAEHRGQPQLPLELAKQTGFSTVKVGTILYRLKLQLEQGLHSPEVIVYTWQKGSDMKLSHIPKDIAIIDNGVLDAPPQPPAHTKNTKRAMPPLSVFSSDPTKNAQVYPLTKISADTPLVLVDQTPKSTRVSVITNGASRTVRFLTRRSTHALLGHFLVNAGRSLHSSTFPNEATTDRYPFARYLHNLRVRFDEQGIDMRTLIKTTLAGPNSSHMLSADVVFLRTVHTASINQDAQATPKKDPTKGETETRPSSTTPELASEETLPVVASFTYLDTNIPVTSSDGAVVLQLFTDTQPQLFSRQQIETLFGNDTNVADAAIRAANNDLTTSGSHLSVTALIGKGYTLTDGMRRQVSLTTRTEIT